jgi:hypothetical protein
MPNFHILQTDAITGCTQIPARSVQTIACSPPLVIEGFALLIKLIALCDVIIGECFVRDVNDLSVLTYQLVMTSDFCTMLFALRLPVTERQHCLCVDALDAQKGKDRTKDNLSSFVRCLITIKQPTALCMRPLFVIHAAEHLSYKFNRFLIDHADLYARMIARALTPWVRRALDTDVSFTVNEASYVS